MRFWGDLDFIGIQTYFPLSRRSDPTLDECVASWTEVAQSMETLSREWGKPVLFTEIGYKSTADGAIRPWECPEWSRGLIQRRSTETQALTYESFFRVFWEKEWCAGAHVWKWRADHATASGRDDIDFTAQNVIARAFSRLGGRTAPQSSSSQPRQ